MNDPYQLIGETAGKIYKYLEQNGAGSVPVMQKEIGSGDSALINQAIGWLAREGKLSFQKKGKNWQVSLAASGVY